MSPTIIQLDGVDIYIANLDHPPPHIHIHYAGRRGRIDLLSLEVEARGISPKKVRRALDWVSRHREYLLECWNCREKGLAIPPLSQDDDQRV